MLHCLANSRETAQRVDDLLTTRQLQDLLQVDRITIYRMLNDGRLRGFKVGGQWRFARREIEEWLQERQTSLDVEESRLFLGGPAAPHSRALPLNCVQAIQSVCAEALDIAAITIEPDGTPLSDISNSRDFCDLILSTDEGRRRCTTAWKALGDRQVRPCHAGLLCVSAPIEISGQSVAITASCQFAAQTPDAAAQAWQTELPALATDLGLAEQDLRAAVGSVRLVSDEYLYRISRLLGRVADTFSEIGEERLNLLSRLQHIAEMSKF